MTLCSVITETIFIIDPHAAQRRGSTSKMRFSSRAQLARDGEGIGSGCGSGGVRTRKRPPSTFSTTSSGMGPRVKYRARRSAPFRSSVGTVCSPCTENPEWTQPSRELQALEHAASEDLLDESRVEVRELQELSLLCKCAVGDERMHVRVEVGGVRAERLDRDHETRRDIPPIEDRADARDDRVTCRAGEQAEQAPLALEQSAQDARNREHDVPVRDGLEELGPAVRAADPRKAALQAAAGEVGLDGCGNHLA